MNLSKNAEIILQDRYLRDDETPDGLFTRVAEYIAEAEPKDVRRYWAGHFENMMSELKFLPNSPTLVNAGNEHRNNLSACFVLTPQDSVESIMEIAKHAALIESWGGGIGFGFSKLRPKGDEISYAKGKACGPVAVMKLYSQIGATITQGSFRMGAHMGQLDVGHSDIREFISCKENDDTLENFNISVQVSDEFMNCVERDDLWNLVNPRSKFVTETVKAKELWELICEQAYRTGDPGVVFISCVQETRPNPMYGYINSSNPCGEEFLEDYGNCCLGSINLYAHIDLVKRDDFNYSALEDTIRIAVRFLDDVIEMNNFPLEELRAVNLDTRRIGLGVMGWADALAGLSIGYGEEIALELAEKVSGSPAHAGIQLR